MSQEKIYGLTMEEAEEQIHDLTQGLEKIYARIAAFHRLAADLREQLENVKNIKKMLSGESEQDGGYDTVC